MLFKGKGGLPGEERIKGPIRDEAIFGDLQQSERKEWREPVRATGLPSDITVQAEMHSIHL